MEQQTDFSEPNSKYGLVLNEFSDLPKERLFIEENLESIGFDE